MAKYFLLFLILCMGCKDPAEKDQAATDTSDTAKIPNSPETISAPVKTDTQFNRTYSNQRFKDVRVEKLEERTFRVKGKAQVFEANLSWVIEDGHEELKKGFQTTSAGAPEWGEFEFTVNVEKKRPNSTLSLILFESSAKDGSRQHELPIVLY